MDMQKLADYARKKVRARELESEAEALKRECRELMPELLEQFTEDGVQNVRIDGVGTVFIAGQIWAGAYKDENGETDYDRTCDALERAGLGMMVKRQFNTNTLSAYVRELPRDAIGSPIIPPELDGEITVSEVFDLRVNKAR